MATADSQAMRQHILDQFQSLEDITATLCRGQALFSAEADRLNAVNSTNMAAEPPAVQATAVETSPERVPGQSDNAEEGYGYGPTVLFSPAAPVIQPVADAYVRLQVPDDGGIDVEDIVGGAASGSGENPAGTQTSVADRKSIMAMARVSRAQSALQAQMEIDAA